VNVEEYISSGILEAYVLSDLSDQEMREVQCMSHIYPEIQEELTRIEESLEFFAMQGKMQTPDFMKDRIMAAIAETEQEGEAPVIEEKAAKLKSLNNNESSGGGRSMLLAAASIALLLICSYTAFQWVQGANENERLQAKIESQEGQLKSQGLDLKNSFSTLEELRTDLEEKKERLAFVSNESTRKIELNGLPGHENSRVTMYYDKLTAESYCEINQLEELSDEQQYQLWAIVDGKPVSMSVFSVDENNQDWMKMEDIANVQTFAITIEPYGGVKSPTIENMVVAGNV
jgi:anti-sigma-K factor RskA